MNDRNKNGPGTSMGTRDYPYGREDPSGRDDRDGWQRGREHAMSEWEHGFHHGRALGEQGYGAEYRGRDGYGGPERRPLGKGPKNWVRSDERMRDDICERLAAQAHDWSDVEVHVSDGEATLTGTVRSRDMKYEAERVADGVAGIKDVTNQLRVTSSAARSSEAQSSEPQQESNGHESRRNRGTSVSR